MPGEPAPENVSVPAVPSTCIVKSDATAVLPFLLTTSLMTVSLGAMSSLVTVHVLASPIANAATQPSE